jgi:hypothetical protein
MIILLGILGFLGMMWLVPAILLMVVATPGMGFWGRVRVGLSWPYFVCLFLLMSGKNNDL